MSWALSLALSLMALSSAGPLKAADSLRPLAGGVAPRSVDELWKGYDPRVEPLEIELVREWTEQGIVYRYVLYTIGTFRDRPARMAAFYAFPADAKEKLPAVLHLHGGGQRAFLGAVGEYARRGYAALSINWGGREMEAARPGDPNTDWGAVDPTQNHVAGYSSLQPRKNAIDDIESPRNNNWFLLTIAARRGITFLEQQEQVDASRIGVWGHSMGGRLTCLVAGTDTRVRAASPSVGGSGFLQTDLWGLPGSARRVDGNLELFRATLAGQAYLSRIACPILFLSSTNDFNAPLDFVQRGMALVPHDRKRTVYALHLNHRFTPETDLARRLWFDSHLRQRLELPDSPQAHLLLRRPDGIPVYRVQPDTSRPIEQVTIHYGYDRDPRNRFWATADAQALNGDSAPGGVWEAPCPVFHLDEPLFVLANVVYRLREDERQEDDPQRFVLSVSDAAYPDALRQFGVKATERPSPLIDDFQHGFRDWYVLQGQNRHHWLFATRKLVDPRWTAPRGARLAVEVTTTAAANTLGVQLEVDSWRANYTGRKHKTYLARVPLETTGRHTIQLGPEDFLSDEDEPLSTWDGVTELIFRSADKARPADASLSEWQGQVPRFANLRWERESPGGS